jgi:hypothetical protein
VIVCTPGSYVTAFAGGVAVSIVFALIVAGFALYRRFRSRRAG